MEFWKWNFLVPLPCRHQWPSEMDMCHSQNLTTATDTHSASVRSGANIEPSNLIWISNSLLHNCYLLKMVIASIAKYRSCSFSFRWSEPLSLFLMYFSLVTIPLSAEPQRNSGGKFKSAQGCGILCFWPPINICWNLPYYNLDFHHSTEAPVGLWRQADVPVGEPAGAFLFLFLPERCRRI